MTDNEWRKTLITMRQKQMTAKQIAKELGLHVATVQKHWHVLPPELQERLLPVYPKRQRILAAIQADSTKNSYEIAEALGVNPRTVQRVRRDMPDYERRGNKCQLALTMIDEKGMRPTAEMAKEIGCSEDTIRRAKRIWRAGGKSTRPEIDDGRPRCKKCGFLPESENPFEDGECLYCRLFYGANVNLFAWHQSGRPAVEGVVV